MYMVCSSKSSYEYPDAPDSLIHRRCEDLGGVTADLKYIDYMYGAPYPKISEREPSCGTKYHSAFHCWSGDLD